ncbi:hypothetical protein M768_05110 [Cellulosimicrobium cellulans F16]|uniref:Uncharacterized protein n=1 Tax=Cellulosimicrobium cellulans F16 TaxID=1350482 RepID=A0A0M0FCN3_CELCE|nr:hypothetical protein M768_05110 [Cellulosimicrobium cellulans F16]
MPRATSRPRRDDVPTPHSFRAPAREPLSVDDDARGTD